MGCGCKDKQTRRVDENGEKQPFNFLNFLGRLGISILLSAILVIVSPFILLFIWYGIIASVFGKNMNLSRNIISVYSKIKPKDDFEEDLDNINPEDYELEGVDIVK